MDAIHQFRYTTPNTISRNDFLKLYHDYCLETNMVQQIEFQMKDVSHLELYINLFKIYCSDKLLNSYQQHIIINYLAKMSYAIRLHHSTDNIIDVDYRRTFVEYIKFVNQLITRKHCTPECNYWFRTLFNIMLNEQHLGLAIVYAEMIHEYSSSNNFQVIQHIFFKYIHTKSNHNESITYELPNIFDYTRKMYNLHHQNINWPIFVDRILSIIQDGVIFYNRFLSTTTFVFDSNLVHILFLFLNHDDNHELFMEILELLNNIFLFNITEYDSTIYTNLLTPHNLMTISNIPELFQGEPKMDIQNEILTFFNIIFDINLHHNIIIPKEVAENICNKLVVCYNNVDQMIVIYTFISNAIKYNPRISYNLEQILNTLHFIEYELDLNNQDLIDVSNVFLNHLFDVFLYNPATTLGLQKNIFKLLVHNYQFLTMTPKSRMIMALVVNEFMKIGHLTNDTEYPTILRNSGYLDIMEEDDNNRDFLRKIKYNYMCTSLKDKCKEWIIDNQEKYEYEEVQDILNMLI